ncbi:YhgE/Pip domain-containing protein [Paenibacillus sp. M1]|uniref:YhgE/Pip domain-containing protein n=1 Tax=Paenibacillus haidiansis TaxID=1574488 RepID=A0ABU7VQL5_9BACL
MKPIFSIYLRDLRSIVTNWAAAVVISGLIILPSLYAWFNIKASWDPYGMTSGIKVAVVNQDQGTALRGQTVKIGDEIVGSLKENHNIGWVFTEENKAMTSLNRGQYYAVILIPDNFSARIASVLTPDPEKAEIFYYVNEKINAVAPKITQKGASSVTSEVNRNFVKTANGAIFSIFNQIGVELEQELPLIRKMKTLAFRIRELYPEINQAADTAVQDLKTGREIVGKVQDALPQAAKLAHTGEEWAGKTAQFLERGSAALDTAAPTVEEALVQMRQAAAGTAQVSGLLLAALEQAEAAEPVTGALTEHTQLALTSAGDAAASLADMLSRLEAAGGGSKLADAIAGLTQASKDFKQMAQLAADIAGAADQAAAGAKDSLAELNALAAASADRLDKLAGSFDSVIRPAVTAAMDRLKQDAGHVQDLLADAVADLPVVDKVVTDAGKGFETAVGAAEAIRKDLPQAENKLKEVTDRITDLEKEGTLEDLIRLLSLNYAKESEFFAEPVTLIEKSLFPIPNYGSAMTPFYTTLSIWVGGLLLVSMLTVEVHERGEGLRSHHEYFGRLLTFLTITLLQTLIITTGDLLLLKTYAANPVSFVLFGLLLACVFTVMIYTLVSVFGNVGKAMAIVFLVLQVAGSGGTFPIQVTPPFFQAIYPFLPFSYGISLLREAVGGSVPEIVSRDIIALLIFVGLFLVLGVLLKKFVNKAAAKWVKKAKDCHLIH